MIQGNIQIRALVIRQELQGWHLVREEIIVVADHCAHLANTRSESHMQLVYDSVDNEIPLNLQSLGDSTTEEHKHVKSRVLKL